MQSARGVIRNRTYANQVKDYSGLRYGNITPTDIDGLIDFGGKVWVFIEIKYGDAALPYGQRLALERLIDIIAETDRTAVALVVSHTSSGDIDVANAVVTEYRTNGQWYTAHGAFTCQTAIRRVLEQSKRGVS